MEEDSDTSHEMIKEKEKALNTIRAIIGHKYVKLLSSGNAALLYALLIVKKSGYKKIIIPDQSGWLNYLDYPEIVGLKIKKIKTNKGLIEGIGLSKLKDSALLYQNPAGYFAEQNSKEIFENKGKGIVVMDIGGCLGMDFIDGKYCDIMIGSFGKWKLVDVGYGGFISSDSKELLEKGKEILRTAPFAEKYLSELNLKLSDINNKIKKMLELREHAIKVFEKFNIVHKGKKGLNIIVKYKNEKEKNNILNLCKKNNFEYRECPCYIRLNEKAVSIELKRE